MNNASLIHHGIQGMKWGIRRTPAQLGRKDTKWAKKNSDKITNKARKAVNKELVEYSNELRRQGNIYNKDGRLNASTINAYNKRMAELMTEKVSDITTPSGKVVKFVAKRGDTGVFMALADRGYDINQLRTGVYDDGRIAYKKTVVDKVDTNDERRRR